MNAPPPSTSTSVPGQVPRPQLPGRRAPFPYATNPPPSSTVAFPAPYARPLAPPPPLSAPNNNPSTIINTPSVSSAVPPQPSFVPSTAVAPSLALRVPGSSSSSVLRPPLPTLLPTFRPPSATTSALGTTATTTNTATTSTSTSTLSTTAPGAHNAAWALQNFSPFRESQDLGTMATPTPSPAPNLTLINNNNTTTHNTATTTATPMAAVANPNDQELRVLRDERGRLAQSLKVSEQRIEELTRASASAQQQILRGTEENAQLRRSLDERSAAPAIKEFYEKELQEERRQKKELETLQARLTLQLQEAQRELLARPTITLSSTSTTPTKVTATATALGPQHEEHTSDTTASEPPTKRQRLGDLVAPATPSASAALFEAALTRHRQSVVDGAVSPLSGPTPSHPFGTLDDDEHARLLAAASESNAHPALWSQLFARFAVALRQSPTSSSSSSSLAPPPHRLIALLSRSLVASSALRASLSRTPVEPSASALVLSLVRALPRSPLDCVHSSRCLLALSLDRCSQLFSASELSDFLRHLVAAVKDAQSDQALALLHELMAAVLRDEPTFVVFLREHNLSDLLAVTAQAEPATSSPSYSAFSSRISVGFESTRESPVRSSLWEQRLLWCRLLLGISARSGDKYLYDRLVESREKLVPSLASRLVLLLHATVAVHVPSSSSSSSSYPSSSSSSRVLVDFVHAGVAVLVALASHWSGELVLPQAVRHPLLGFVAAVQSSELWLAVIGPTNMRSLEHFLLQPLGGDAAANGAHSLFSQVSTTQRPHS